MAHPEKLHSERDIRRGEAVPVSHMRRGDRVTYTQGLSKGVSFEVRSVEKNNKGQYVATLQCLENTHNLSAGQKLPGKIPLDWLELKN